MRSFVAASDMSELKAVRGVRSRVFVRLMRGRVPQGWRKSASQLLESCLQRRDV